MRVDLRVKHDVEARKAAIGLFELGHGYKSAAIALSLPAEAVRRWQEIYRAFGSEVLLRMDGKQGRYTYEQKVAAASAVVDGGMTKTEAMAAFGIMSMSPLKKWCALYREGGAEALRPRPKGRPSGSRARPRTREEELEERCRRLEAAGIVQSMSRKANCIDNAATEQLFGHVKDEFYRGREWKTFEDFKRDLEEYIVHWNTSRRQVRLKGLTPEEYRNQALAA